MVRHPPHPDRPAPPPHQDDSYVAQQDGQQLPYPPSPYPPGYQQTSGYGYGGGHEQPTAPPDAPPEILPAKEPSVEYDNFYTPKNEFFYSKSPYLNLNPRRREIRLLKVHPRKPYIEHVKANPHWTPKIRAESSGGQSLPLDEQTVMNLIHSYQEFGISQPNTPLIACELVDKVMLSAINASYCALSYCAGKPTETAVVLVNGLPFNAFANLEHAIGCALECWTSRNPGEELLLWVDQICINQCDGVEKGRQVGMMRDIYRRSNETFVCLSTASVDNCLLWVPRDPRAVSEHQLSTQNALAIREEPHTVATLKHIFRELLLGKDAALSSTMPEPASSRGQLLRLLPSASAQPQPQPQPQSGNSSLENQSQSWNPFLQNQPPPQSPYLLSLRRALTPSSYSESTQSGTGPVQSNLVNLVRENIDVLLESIRAFMECPWWHWSWAYQEFIISPRPHFLSGSTSVPWMELYPVLEFVCSGLDAFLDSMIAFAISKAEQEEAKRQELKEAEQERAQAQYNVQMCEYNRKLDEYWKQAEWQRQDRQQAIDEYNAKLTNKAADLASKNATTNPLNFPLKLILKYETHRIDNKQKNSDRDISEWIDKARRGQYDTGSRHYEPPPKDPLIRKIINSNRAADPYYGCNSPPPPPLPPLPPSCPSAYAQFQNKWKEKEKRIAALQIRLRGFDSSTVSSMMEGKTKIQRPSDLKELLQHSRKCEASDPRDRIYAFLGLAHRGYGIEPNYTMQNTVIQLLIDTTSRIIEYDKSLKVLEHVYQGRKELGHYLPTWVPDWTSKESGRGFKKYDLVWGAGQEARPFDASKGLPTKAEFRKDDTNESIMDMKVKGVFVGVLDELEKTAESFPDLQSFLMPYDGRNLRVISPNSAAVDDEVWVLHGMSQPVVLEHLYDDTYSFLGEVLVCELDGSFSEVMFGQMIQMAEQGRSESREIWLA